MKKTLILSLALAASSLSVQASSIVLSDFSGTTLSNPVTMNSGAALPNLSVLVRVGYFNVSAQSPTWAADIASSGTPLDITRINLALQSFIPLGENAAAPNLGDVPTAATGPRVQQRTINTVSQPGRLAGQITNVNPTSAGAPNTVNAGGVPNGSRIFLLVYSDNDSVLHDGEQFGVFSADTWLMPSDASLPLPLNTTEVNTAGEVYRGTFGSLKLNPVGVPEPATGGLALLAGLGLISRRRR